MKIRFIDLHVHSKNSSGENQIEDYLRVADMLKIKLGFCDGIKYSEYISGIEIKPKNIRELNEMLKKCLNEFDFILVDVKEPRLIRKCSENYKIDIISFPHYIDYYIARSCRDNNIAIEIKLRDLITATGSKRIKVLSNIKEILRLKRKYEFDLIITSGAKSIYELRSSTDISSMLKIIGFEEDEIKEAMEIVPKKIVEYHRKYYIISRGVRILRNNQCQNKKLYL